MMNKLEAYHILAKMWNDLTPEQDEAVNIAMDCIEFVDLIPDDMVRVVRCKDCIHYETCEGGKDFCCFHAIGIVPDDFCSYGERKEAEGDG